jgi:hypothetical protein
MSIDGLSVMATIFVICGLLAGPSVNGMRRPRFPGWAPCAEPETTGAIAVLSAVPEVRTMAKRKTTTARWSNRVTRESNALDLDHGVFTWKSPKRIAASLKRSAERSRRRKAEPYRSAMSMLTFYINRAGRDLPSQRRKVLNSAKEELRRQFGRAER